MRDREGGGRETLKQERRRSTFLIFLGQPLDWLSRRLENEQKVA
jgi:hypothetical protein